MADQGRGGSDRTCRAMATLLAAAGLVTAGVVALAFFLDWNAAVVPLGPVLVEGGVALPDGSHPSPMPEPVAIGEPLPSVPLTDLDGKQAFLPVLDDGELLIIEFGNLT